MTFNNVSERPRNPNNGADNHEMEDLDYFRNNPGQTVRLSKKADSRGNQYYHYVRPIRVEEYCLKCHGKREEAPLTIRAVYENAFDYHVGELRGIMSIKIGDRDTKKQMSTIFIINLLLHGIIFILLFWSVNYILQRFQVVPLARLNDTLSALAAGESSEMLEGLGEDFTTIENSINTLTKHIHKTSS